MNFFEKIKNIFQDQGVGLAYFFGSQQEAGVRWLRGESVTPKAGSDLDLGVVFLDTPRDYRELTAWREALRRELTPLFGSFRLHVVALPEENAHVQHAAIHGALVYKVSDEVEREYRRQVWALYADWHSWWP